VASSYVSLASNLVYSIASVPLALHFVTKQEFGLWALMFQIASCLAVIDFGMSPAVARLLIEEKDRPDGGGYGSLIQTAVLVSLLQGFLILATGAAPGPVLRRSPADTDRSPAAVRCPRAMAMRHYRCDLGDARVPGYSVRAPT
jgi:O-antigen/teichoic acid export membrane protein